ncbi:MAG TPA: outer membrane beta-barrel protein [Gemmatimonadales bacterium]|nr:outer membrane beta-barrel protein [Gemmatimonadales bacterium]
MKRTTLAVLAAVAFTMAMAVPAAAQKSSIGIGAGLTMPMGDYGDADKMGFHFGAGAKFGLGSAPISLRIEGSYSTTSHDGVDGKFNIMGGMASLVYPIQTAGSLKPYALFGVGYFNVKETDSDVSESGVGFGGGLGVNFAMSSTNLFVEARYVTSKAADVNFGRVPLTVGVSFPLGAK